MVLSTRSHRHASCQNASFNDEDDIKIAGLPNTTRGSDSGSEIFDIIGHVSGHGAGSGLPKTPVVCKPSEDAIERALRVANINTQRTILFENSVRNIQAGKRIGLQTVCLALLTGQKVQTMNLRKIYNLREAIPELWEFEVKSEVGYSGKVAVETSMTA